MRYTTLLIERIAEIGRAKGFKAADIAERAGISPAALSRARKTGKFNSDTLERLIAALDIAIALEARTTPKSHTLSMVTKKLNAGRRLQLKPEELRPFLRDFRRSKKAERAYSHLIGVIEEVPIDQLHTLVIDGEASFRSLGRIAAFVEGEGETVEWIRGNI